MKRTVAVLMWAALSASAAWADEASDCTLVRGLAVAADLMVQGDGSRSMDVNGWLAKFEVNLERQRAFSRHLTEMGRLMTTETGTMALGYIKNTLDATVDGGRGDVYYWRDMVSAQFRSYGQVFQAMGDLRNRLCH